LSLYPVSIADSFKTFLANIAVDNADVITLRYEEITSALNKTFRDTESKEANSLQVGSYGRWTAIKGISDLDTDVYDDKSYLYYDEMFRDFLLYLSNEPEKDRYAALGSGQHVKVKKKFQKKAKKGYDLCVEAIAAAGQDNEYKKWRKIFGRHYPAPQAEVEKAYISEGNHQARNTEEHIEDRFPIDIRHTLKIDCEVSQSGFRTYMLRDMLAKRFRLLANKSLKFSVVKNAVPGDYELYWKVLNRGAEAVRRDNIRGQITHDTGYARSAGRRQRHPGQHVIS
jgi:hypothetical protein